MTSNVVETKNPAPEGFEKIESEEFGKVLVVTGPDGEPWFVAKDICAVLGLTNSRKALSRLDEDEKNTVTISYGIRGTLNISIINKSGYHLTITRRKDFAKRGLGAGVY